MRFVIPSDEWELLYAYVVDLPSLGKNFGLAKLHAM